MAEDTQTKGGRMPQLDKHTVFTELMERFQSAPGGLLAPPETENQQHIRTAKELALFLLGAGETAARAAEAIAVWDQVEKWAEKIGDANLKNLIYIAALGETLKTLSGPSTAFEGLMKIATYLGHKTAILKEGESFEVKTVAPSLDSVITQVGQRAAAAVASYGSR